MRNDKVILKLSGLAKARIKLKDSVYYHTYLIRFDGSVRAIEKFQEEWAGGLRFIETYYEYDDKDIEPYTIDIIENYLIREDVSCEFVEILQVLDCEISGYEPDEDDEYDPTEERYRRND